MNLSVSNCTGCPTTKKQNVTFGNTLCIIKPEVYHLREQIMDEYIKAAGFNVVKSWDGIAPKEVLKKHYNNIADKPFFQSVIDYMHSGMIRVMEIKGGNNDISKNAIHASDSAESAKHEINDIWGNYLNLSV